MRKPRAASQFWHLPVVSFFSRMVQTRGRALQKPCCSPRPRPRVELKPHSSPASAGGESGKNKPPPLGPLKRGCLRRTSSRILSAKGLAKSLHLALSLVCVVSQRSWVAMELRVTMRGGKTRAVVDPNKARTLVGSGKGRAEAFLHHTTQPRQREATVANSKQPRELLPPGS